MKQVILLITALVLSTQAFAGNVERPNVYDHYKTVVNQTPYHVEVCTPGHTTYNDSASSADVLFGAILGGVIGNQVGGGSGKDAATILGAILGADITNKRHSGMVTTGPSCTVETRYKETVSEVYSHSTITFMVNGKGYSLDFAK